MVSVERINTEYKRPTPTETADTIAIDNQNLTTPEDIRNTTKHQLETLLADYHIYSNILSPEAIAERYHKTLEPLTFAFGSQLIFEEPTPDGRVASLHPPTPEDVAFFFDCHDAAVAVMSQEKHIHPEAAPLIEQNITFLTNIAGRAIDEMDADPQTVRDMNRALDLAEEQGQGIAESYQQIRTGNVVKLTLAELAAAAQNDPEITIASKHPETHVVMPAADSGTYDGYFPYEYAKRLEHIDQPEAITFQEAVRLANEIAPDNPEVADAALAGIARHLVKASPIDSLEVAKKIQAPNLKAIRLSDVLRAHSNALQSDTLTDTHRSINQLFDEVVANSDPTRRILDMAEIAANLDDTITTESVKNYISYLSQEGRGTYLNAPIEAIFSAIDNTSQDTSFTKAFTNEMVKVHNDVDAMRAKYMDEPIPLAPKSRVKALERRKRYAKLRQKVIGGALLKRI